MNGVNAAASAMSGSTIRSVNSRRRYVRQAVGFLGSRSGMRAIASAYWGEFPRVLQPGPCGHASAPGLAEPPRHEVFPNSDRAMRRQADNGSRRTEDPQGNPTAVGQQISSSLPAHPPNRGTFRSVQQAKEHIREHMNVL